MTTTTQTRPLSAQQRACLERLAAGDALEGNRGFKDCVWRYNWRPDWARGPRDATMHALQQRGLVRLTRGDTIWHRRVLLTAAGRAAVAPEVAR